MTEKMRVLHALSVHGERDLGQIADITGIPAGRVFAALQDHIRHHTIRVRTAGRRRYAATGPGRSLAAHWGCEKGEHNGA